MRRQRAWHRSKNSGDEEIPLTCIHILTMTHELHSFLFLSVPVSKSVKHEGRVCVCSYYILQDSFLLHLTTSALFCFIPQLCHHFDRNGHFHHPYIHVYVCVCVIILSCTEDEMSLSDLSLVR